MRPPSRAVVEPHTKLLDLRVFGGIAVKVVSAGLQFLAIPVIISRAGLEIYGLFGLFSIVIMYFAMADIGITKSTVRFISMSRTEDHTEIFSVIFLLTGLFSFAVVGIGYLLSEPVLRLIGLEVTATNRMIYDLALVTSFLMVARSLYLSAAYALENFKFVYNTTVIFEILRWGGSIAAVLMFDNAILSLITTLAIATFLHVATLAYLVHVTGRIRITIPRNGRRTKSILRYSLSVFTIDVTNKISSYADKILVAATGLVLSFAHYYIAFQVVGKVADFLSGATIPYIQRVAKQFGTEDTAAIRTTMTDAYDKIGFLFLPPILTLLVFGKTYLELWLGREAAEDVYPYLAVLSAGYGLTIYGTISINLSNALGRTSVSILSSALMAAAILVGSFFALPRFGPLGMGVVWAACQAIPLVVVFPATMRLLGISQIGLVLRAIATATGIAVTFLAAKLLVQNLFADPGAYEVLAFALTSLALSYAPAALPLLKKLRASRVW